MAKAKAEEVRPGTRGHSPEQTLSGVKGNSQRGTMTDWVAPTFLIFVFLFSKVRFPKEIQQVNVLPVSHALDQTKSFWDVLTEFNVP